MNMKVCLLMPQKWFMKFSSNTVCYVVFLSRQAPSQQIWHWSDERSRSYECVKIAPLLFLLHSLCAPLFLMPQEALRCVLVTTPNLVGNASYWELCSSTCECSTVNNWQVLRMKIAVKFGRNTRSVTLK